MSRKDDKFTGITVRFWPKAVFTTATTGRVRTFKAVYENWAIHLSASSLAK